MELPVAPLFTTSNGILVIEVVVWSTLTLCWVHMVSEHFQRELPAEHVQVTVGDLVWVRQVVRLHGPQAIRNCVFDLQQEMVPGG